MAELASGLVETGTHFEIDKLWSKISQNPEAKRIKEMFRMILAEDTRRDLEEIRNDLRGRDYGSFANAWDVMKDMSIIIFTRSREFLKNQSRFGKAEETFRHLIMEIRRTEKS